MNVYDNNLPKASLNEKIITEQNLEIIEKGEPRYYMKNPSEVEIFY